MHVWIDEWIYVWMDEWMDGWIGTRKEGMKKRQATISASFKVNVGLEETE